MKTKKVISLCLIISIILALPFSVFATNQSETIQAREFTMLVKDTETGVVSSVECDTFNGNSGGAILNHSKQIIGIHTKGAINSGGTNSGTRMIEEIYNYIENLI